MYILRIINKDIKFIVLISLLGVINSSLYGFLLLVLNSSISGDGFFMRFPYTWILFFGLMIISYICKKKFQRFMIKFTNTILFDFEVSILQKLRETDYETYNRFDSSKVYTAMGDIKVLAQLPRFFIDMVNNIVVILVSLTYLFWVSATAAIGILLVAVLFFAYYAYKNGEVVPLLKKSRDLENDYFRYLNDFVAGFKELKVDRRKNDNIFHKFFSNNRKTARDYEIEASMVYMNNELLGSYGWFFMLGVIVFGISHLFYMGAGGTTTFVVIILYLMGPISTFINSIPFIARMRIAMKRVEDFTKEINNVNPEKSAAGNTLLPFMTEEIKNISFNNVHYEYKNNINGKQFSLGPVNLSVKKGDVVFITGDNGSGKSTFLLLLTGLLRPCSGAVFVNGEMLSADNYEAFRSNVATVFVDSFLFSENYNDFAVDTSNPEFIKYLRLMQLSPDIVAGGALKNLKLSKGQQKRLSLIYALMEGKDILVLDEWAAEQDPAFRAYFYNTIITELKKAGKTIIAVTHDDKYFDCASRLLQFKSGRIVNDVVLEKIPAFYE
jgi:cyclic peptide transporter